ncbi:MerR family DNA-binding protein [Nocardia sp. CA-084685]|uniref:MerR family DNA-binding protein n=1 Tax=Nocardia sp. CA-084685 TaxID=3239970 RepID=UPI003D953948
MHARPLGRTGIQVSPYALGTMKFGRFGNPDHQECIHIVHRGGRLFGQIMHGGRISHPDTTGLQPVGPSPVAARGVLVFTPTGPQPAPVVRLLQRLYAAGLSSSTIAELLPCGDSPSAAQTDETWARLLKEREQLQQHIAELLRTRDTLDEIIETNRSHRQTYS